MGLFDGILGQVSEHADIANLAAKPGIGRSEAFRQSVLALIAEGKPPAYWAPFVVVGEGGAAH